ncbi:MAG: ZIP family metal transporter [Actinomycetota bacterium]
MTPVSVETRRSRWVVLGAIVAVGIVVAGSISLLDQLSLREVPEVEALTVERSVLEAGRVELRVRNDGPDEVRLAQVLVNDAYWSFTASDSDVGRLEATTIAIPYPWEEGLPLNIGLVTSTGVVIEHEIEAAVATPPADASTFLVYGLLGVYIGVLPVTLGLFAFPLIRRLSAAWLGFFLALTLGLLAFLLVDTIAHGFELAAAAPAALDGLALFAIGLLVAVLALMWLEGALGRRKGAIASANARSGLSLSYLIAVGIGLHNLGEGLAVGAALAVGEVALGTFLIIGFALHNTTEGLAIVAPLGTDPRRPSLKHFVALGLIAGAPTIAGAWIGGFAFSAAWSALAFGVAAGAIAQVIWTVGNSMRGEASITRGLPALGFVAGLVIMYATGLLTV